VIISGNSRTLDRVIRRNVYLAPQDLFNLTDLEDSKSALKRTGYFEKVEITQEKITNNKVNLLVKVSEAPTGSIIFGGWYGSYDIWMINASVNDKNIFGSGLDLGFSIDWSKRKTNFKLSLDNPAINDSIYSGSASVFKSKETRDLKYKDEDGTIVDDVETSEAKGLSLGVGRKLTRHTRVGLIYALTKTKSTYKKDIEENLDYVTSSLTPYIRFDNTDDYFVPRSGMRAGTSLQYAGIGGDSKFLKSYSYFKYYKGLDDYLNYDLIFKYKVQVQVLEDKGKLLPRDSLYMGGTGSVRGYRTYAFGRTRTDDSPYKKMFANSVELSFPLMPRAKVRWGLFYDYGMIGKEKFSAIKRSGAGALIEWFSPVGPIQFIFSKPLNDKPGDKTSKFEFSLGSQF
jgi:outer membrane protein insertion porin family